ncbi:MAG: glycosyltransferase family 2 protein [Saprospiraceae bacterium]|nr:glycosyltransferase family 2 protein [Saprospiraceae bacterium]
MNPLVSVLLPVFNGSHTLGSAIQSILNQSFQDFELVIIDDGSTDNCAQIVNGYSDKRIRYFQREHEGLAASLNFGISKCRGKYIARMDADDISHIDRLTRQVQFLETKSTVDLVATRVSCQSSNDNRGLDIYIEWQNNFVSHEEIYLNRFVDSPIIHPSIMARKSAFEKYGYYSTDELPEDFELWLRWLQGGARFEKIKKELLVWNDNPLRLTRSHPYYSKDKFCQTKANYLAKWFQKQFSDSKPDIWILGSGRHVFQRSNWLTHYGLEIKGFVDLESKPSSKRRIIGYNQISSLENSFFLSYVSDRAGRKNIKNFMKESGYSIGQQFYMMT